MGVVTIGDVAKLVRGVSYKKEVSRNEPSENYVALLRANNIVNGAFSFDELVYVPSSLVNSEQFLDEGDIMITMSSGSKAHVGKVALSKTKLDCAFGAFCAKIKMNEAVLPKYLYYVMLDGEFRKYIEHQSKGTNINNLKRDYILGFSFNLPPLEEQRRIVARIEELFSELDAAVATLERTKEQLAVYRQAVLKEAFTKDNSWESCSLGDVIRVLTDYHSNGSYKVLKENVTLLDEPSYAIMVRSTNFEKDDFKTDLKYINQHSYDFLKKSQLFGDEVLMGKIGNAGKVYYMKSLGRPMSLAMNMFAMRFNEGIYSKFVYYYLLSSEAIADIKQYVKGVGTPTIDKKSVRSLKFVYPNENRQMEIVDMIESRLSVCDKIEETVNTALQEAEAMRQSILKQAFAGEL
ncbi:MAG: restriction endonuclease subunit S [Methanocorpusculum sp.]|nr:restriction endonuclease subunit S [Methanocorpusculum sp.]